MFFSGCCTLIFIQFFFLIAVSSFLSAIDIKFTSQKKRATTFRRSGGNVAVIVPLVETRFDTADETPCGGKTPTGSNSFSEVFYHIPHAMERHPPSCTVLREMAAVSVVCVLL